MKYVYPAIFKQTEIGTYSAIFPDIAQGATMGKTIAECMENARDFLVFALYEMERDGESIPLATDLNKIECEKNDIVNLMDVDTDTARRWHETRTVRKTLTIPSWLNERAEAANVNFSQELQKALKKKLNLVSAR